MQFPPLTPSQSHRGVVVDLLDAVGFHIRTQSDSMSLLQHNVANKKNTFKQNLHVILRLILSSLFV